MNNIIQDPLTITFCAIILIGAFIFGVQLWLSTRKLITQLNNVNSELQQCKAINEFDEDGEIIDRTWSDSALTIAYQNRDKMHNQIIAAECLKAPWNAYKRSMQIPGENFELKEKQAPALRNTMQVNSLFNMENIVESQINVRLMTSVPNMLTGLGLLFTFVGLVIGIAGASSGLSSADSEAARQSLYPLLSGASIAFTTSIVGIICSMAFNIFEKNRFFQLEREVKKFSDYLATHIEFIDSDKLAAMQLEAIEGQTKALNDFQVDQQRITDETIRRVSEEFRETLLDNAGSEIEELADLIAEMNKSMGENLSSFTDNQVKAAKATEELTQTLQTSIVNITEKLKDSSDAMGEREEQRVSRIVSTFETVCNDMSQVMTETTSAINGREEERVNRIINSFEIASNDISKVITNSTTEIEEQLYAQSRISLDNIKQASEWYGKTMADSAQLLDNIPERITLASEQSVQNSSQQLQALMAELLPETVAQVSNSLGQQVNSLMSQVTVAESNLANILQQFPDVAVQLGKLNQELVGNAQVIGRLHESTKSSLSNFVDTSQSLNESVTHMAEANTFSAELAKNYMVLLKDIQGSAKDASESNKTAQQTSVNLKHALKEHSHVSQSIKAALDSSLSQLHRGLSDYADLTNKHMSSLDHDASKVSSHLVEAIKEVDILVKDIARVSSKMSNVA